MSFGAQETDRTKAVGRSYTETDFELNMKIVLTELSKHGVNCLKSL